MKKITGMIIVMLFLLSAANAEEPKYTNSSFARLSFVSGKTYIQKAADFGYEEGVLNMPISEGDRLGTTEGRAEIYLNRKNYIRLDQNTKIDFMNLPKRGSEAIRIKVWAGNIYLNVGYLEKEKNIEIHTSDASIYVLDEGLYRIDVRENKETEIFVFRGLVEAAGEEGSILVKNEQRLAISEGHLTSRPTAFFAVAEDTFDRWNESREAQITKHLARAYLPSELEDFEYELAAYGDWVYLQPYGYVWVPRGLTSDWHPYFYGRWIWIPLCGWCWVPYESWGWLPFHYGRWHWGMGLGWYWIPTTIWGPAWVSWWWDYDYFAWAPLSYWGYPVAIINNVFYGHSYYSNYPNDSTALTVIHRTQLQANNISDVALSRAYIRRLGRINLAEQKLSLRPITNPKVLVDQLEGKRVLLRKETRPTEFESQKIREKGPLKGRDIFEPKIENSKKDQNPPQSPPPAAEEKVKKKEKGSDSGEGEAVSGSYTKKETYGFPSSPEVSRESSSREKQSSRSRSFLDRVYRYFSEGSSSSRGSLQRRSISRESGSFSTPRSFSRPSSSSRPSSFPSSHSSPRSGNIKKRN